MYIYMWLTFYIYIVTGLFGLIGIIIYAAEVNSFRNDDPAVLVDYQLSWSFALATIAACLTLIATACLGVGWRMGN